MANRKQQKRKYNRAKAHSRGVDGTLPPEERSERKPTRGSSGRRVREIREPNLRRAAGRAGIFAVLFFLAQHFTSLGGKNTVPEQVIASVVMFVGFTLVGVLTERFVWRRHLKQQQEHAQP